MRVGFQVDKNLNFATDTSILLMIEAQKRGYDIFSFNPEQVFLKEGKAYASLYSTSILNENQLVQDSLNPTLLDELDIIFIRQDPPFNMRYYTNTFFLEKCKSLVINNPKGIRNFPEKLFHLNDYMLPTLITEDVNSLNNFLFQYKVLVLKPLYSYGGEGVIKIDASTNLEVIANMMLNLYKAPIIAQQFCEEVLKGGDKRILILDGDVLGGFRRYNEKDFRSNLKLGAKSYATTLSTNEVRLAEQVAKTLKENGIILGGLDILGEKILEINVTSPTGLRQFNAIYNTDIEKKCWDCFENNLNL